MPILMCVPSAGPSHRLTLVFALLSLLDDPIFSGWRQPLCQEGQEELWEQSLLRRRLGICTPRLLCPLPSSTGGSWPAEGRRQTGWGEGWVTLLCSPPAWARILGSSAVAGAAEVGTPGAPSAASWGRFHGASMGLYPSGLGGPPPWGGPVESCRFVSAAFRGTRRVAPRQLPPPRASSACAGGRPCGGGAALPRRRPPPRP